MKRKATSQPRRYRRSGFRQPLYRPPSVAARASRRLSPEVKIQTRSLDGTGFTNATTVQETDITRVAGGSEVYQRIGNKIKALAYDVKGIIYGAGSEYFLRVVVIKLHNATDTPADTSYNLLYGTAGPTTLTAAGDNLSMTLPLNTQRFDVLYDKTFTWPTEASSGFRAQGFSCKGSLNHIVKFGSATSNDWDAGRTTVLYWAGKTDGTAFSNTPLLWAAASLYYTDV